VWNFRLAAIRSAKNGLRNARAALFTKDDINHYQKIIAVLFETIRIMAEIDTVSTVTAIGLEHL
jgi:hypothetical protein